MFDIQPATRMDLHLHTSASDGRFDLEETLVRCATAGLDLVSITDHDLGLELAPGPRQVGDRTLQILPGAEISGVHADTEFHLLVYFPHGVPDAFHAFCVDQCAERTDRYAIAMQNLDLPLPAQPRATALTRFHLAAELIERGIVASRPEAFERFLGSRHGLVPRLSTPFTECIRFAREQGGITSWAHPPRRSIQPWIQTFVDAGLQGLEGHRPALSSADRKYIRKYARQYGLFLTGGSDWHGWRHDNPGLFRICARDLVDFVDVLQAA